MTRKKSFSIIWLLALCLTLLSCLILANPAQANITITPMTVVIEGRDKYADVNLINTSDETKSYEIGWLYYRQKDESGSYEYLQSSPTPFDLADNIVFTPKRVTLPARSTQKVRLAVRLKGEPPAAGDYRAHLEFKQAGRSQGPVPPKPIEDESGDPDKPKVQLGVGVNIAFSIPVVYRVGESDAQAQVEDISLRVNPDTQKIEALVPIARTGGNYGIMGHLELFYQPRGGAEIKVAELKNANIFPELSKRLFKMVLSVPTVSDGSLRVVLRDPQPQKNIIYAEKTINIDP